ncbi:MAG: response regulator [Verrucomicrobia bacterium]|nr:response regulator [Verrucomicrobiota bacterium]
MARKILIVDDEPFMQRLIQLHLEKAGYELVKARNGHEALDAVQREKPHLIVMDVMMAGMDGLTALSRLKQDQATQDIPVIIMTAKAHTITRQEAEQSGAAVVFTKPFSPTQLLLEIRRLLPDAPPQT